LTKEISNLARRKIGTCFATQPKRGAVRALA
jgi:hypothetical protein